MKIIATSILIKNNMVQTILFAYGNKFNDVRVQKKIMYAMAAAKRDATTKIQQQIDTTITNTRNDIARQTE